MSVQFDPATMALRGRIGGLATHSKHDTRVVSLPGRLAAEARFLDEVDPNRELPEAERLRRASYARKAFYARLAYQSVMARRRGARTGTKTAAVDQTTAVGVEAEVQDHASGQQLQPA